MFLRDSHWRFKCFHTSTLKQVSEKLKPFFKELEHCFLDESTTIESATFQYKTSLSKANVNAN